MLIRVSLPKALTIEISYELIFIDVVRTYNTGTVTTTAGVVDKYCHSLHLSGKYIGHPVSDRVSSKILDSLYQHILSYQKYILVNYSVQHIVLLDPEYT